MSKYTTEVRYICESYAGLKESVGFNEVENVITQALPKIFDFDFPIFDENYREVLERKIVRHFYTREIGFETVGLWKLKLNTKLNEIMPLYNQRYKSTLLEYNPLYSVNKTIHRGGDGKLTREGTDTVKEDGTRDINNTNKYSDTPQGTLQNLVNDTYLTNATINNTHEAPDLNTKTTYGTTFTTTNDYTDTIYGLEGRNPSKMLEDFRKTFLNIDMEIINELESLFMLLW